MLEKTVKCIMLLPSTKPETSIEYFLPHLTFNIFIVRFFFINSSKNFSMIIVHDIFICKPGNASKMAKLFKEVMADNEEMVNIMTDLTGQYNRVIMVSKYESLSAFEKSFEKYMQDSEEMRKMREKMKGYTDMYISGSREIYQVW